MTHHGDLTEAMRRLTPDAASTMPGTRLAECLIHAADLSNPVLPAFPTVYKWAIMVCDEFTQQVTREQAAGYPFAPHMVGLSTPQAIAKLQLGFVDYVVSPLWMAIATALPELADAGAHLSRNRAAWKAIVDGGAPPGEGGAEPDAAPGKAALCESGRSAASAAATSAPA